MENNIVKTERVKLENEGRINLHVFEDNGVIIAFEQANISVNMFCTCKDLKALFVSLSNIVGE